MSHYIAKRLLGMLFVIFVIIIFSFLFVHLLPGDPAQIYAGGDATLADIANVRHRLGLDQSLLSQFYLFVSNLFQGHLGVSYASGESVVDILKPRLMVTATLGGMSLWFIPMGIFFGFVAAVFKGRLPDRLSMVLAVGGISIPDFWLGLVLMQIFAVHLGWFNPTGYESLSDLVLPSITLGMMGTAIVARFTRSAFLDVLSENYIQTAKAKGLSEFSVLIGHAFRNALLPIVTVIGLQIGFVLSGSIVIENIFSLPGLGALLIDSVNNRDFPIVQMLLMIFAFNFVFINFLVDILYMVINPQIRMK